MALKTDYKNDVFSGQRKYTMTDNGDNTVSFTDVTTYSQVGDNFGASDINAANTAVNNLTYYLEQAQTLSTSGNTDFTFSDAKIQTGSMIEVYAGRTTGDVSGEQNSFGYSSIYTTTGQCVITYPPFSSEISLTVRIYIK